MKPSAGVGDCLSISGATMRNCEAAEISPAPWTPLIETVNLRHKCLECKRKRETLQKLNQAKIGLICNKVVGDGLGIDLLHG